MTKDRKLVYLKKNARNLFCYKKYNLFQAYKTLKYHYQVIHF